MGVAHAREQPRWAQAGRCVLSIVCRERPGRAHGRLQVDDAGLGQRRSLYLDRDRRRPGTYETINQAQERTRGPFHKKTGLFSSSIAEAGQGKGDRRLDGWVDIDAYNKGKPDPAESTVST